MAIGSAGVRRIWAIGRQGDDYRNRSRILSVRSRTVSRGPAV
jgi:hypothetical protein